MILITLIFMDRLLITFSETKRKVEACYVKQVLTPNCLTSKSMVVDDVFECTTL